jgi:hypothetical protein
MARQKNMDPTSVRLHISENNQTDPPTAIISRKNGDRGHQILQEHPVNENEYMYQSTTSFMSAKVQHGTEIVRNKPPPCWWAPFAKSSPTCQSTNTLTIRPEPVSPPCWLLPMLAPMRWMLVQFWGCTHSAKVRGSAAKLNTFFYL